MIAKRILLLGLTIIALVPVLLSLINSINQPQVQANLQLYQTNLILQASEFSWQDLPEVKQVLIGKDTNKLAINQYQQALKSSQTNLENLENQLTTIITNLEKEGSEDSSFNPSSKFNFTNSQVEQKLEQEINNQKQAINQLNLKLGILQVHQGKITKGIETWENLLIEKNLANSDLKLNQITEVLIGLWSDKKTVLPNAEEQINSSLQGWFQTVNLKRLYEIQDRKTDLKNLENQQQETAYKAIIKLALVGIIPFALGLIGFVLLLLVLLQLLLKKQESILFINQNFAWKTPWTIETIWQVLIVGFFFIGQIILPLVFGLIFGGLNINPTNFTLRQTAFYVLISYLSLAISGISVLYLSIKSFFPLAKDWFQFKWQSNWIVWGIGGYLVALPLVIIVSLINQQLWNGQGGSNPLLSLALEAQDSLVLAIFYVTASLAAPVYEEIIFRGFLLPSLTRYIPVWAAIGLSSLIFALAHLNLSEVLPLAILGIVLGVVYTRSRNLLSSMLVHSLWNSGTLFSLFILGSGGQ
ncbi:Abortive infection protein [Rippkaea orientalis PCC 8801]|uniref:Abortive infection protein n=1 Tax=Rippkaea orientalis (strain PCC 8801 / RF-1) TaxID=41431 RepID=B7K3Y7_RIPO1|nr:type II CAAX endopeptidase family protein [Rippkaea orientalis]ACK66527.1 Abortive infection protein [Rippkaea orientalis PCC 8801]